MVSLMYRTREDNRSKKEKKKRKRRDVGKTVTAPCWKQSCDWAGSKSPKKWALSFTH